MFWHNHQTYSKNGSIATIYKLICLCSENNSAQYISKADMPYKIQGFPTYENRNI